MNTWQHLTMIDYKTLLAAGPVQAVDIRDPAAYEAGHIPDAQALNDASLEGFLASADKTKVLVVCCYHGHSSQNVAEFLVQQGFEDVYSLDGGYTAWAAGQASLTL